jgi:glycosyltransferase involved in cell wall biosynthesis
MTRPDHHSSQRKALSSSKKPADITSIAFLGGYLPRLCGIATFTHDLCEALAAEAPESDCFVCAVNDRAEPYGYPSRVRFEINEKDLSSYGRAADNLNFNNAEILCVQHEFGIFGGRAGSHVLSLLEKVRMPVVTTLHTILGNPDAEHRYVMERLAACSQRMVVMAEKGAQLLHSVYDVPWDKIDLIPHGIPDIPFIDSYHYKAQFGLEDRNVLLTFGLLGPGKGIEYVIEALPAIIKRHPDVVYVILGATHPHLVAKEGETYRLGLERQIEKLGVKSHVIFYNQFVSLSDLKEFIGATDIYITPYLNEEQITSGTLAYVFGAGKAVVSTPYWHARELLGEGRGSLVPFRDSGAIAEAVCGYFSDEDVMQSTRMTAYKMGRDMIWPVTARRYMECFRQAIPDVVPVARAAFADWTLSSRPSELPALNFDHIRRMSDATGILQHASYTVPNYHEGYCTDDNARASILMSLALELNGSVSARDVESLSSSYLAFLHAAFNTENQRFRNFMGYNREWIEKTGSEDSHARAIWALGNAVGQNQNSGHKKLALWLLELGIHMLPSFSSPRAWAFGLLGLHEVLREHPGHRHALKVGRALSANLVSLWKGFAGKEWPWFEQTATYDNGRLSQALILSASLFDDPEALEIGLSSLRWLVSVQVSPQGDFRPIGCNGFYSREGPRAAFDQQPVEAQSMVAACLSAFQATGDRHWSQEARRAFDWFLGRNDLGLALYDPVSGGCADGLHSNGVSENQGAESTLAFQLALAEMRLAERKPIKTRGNQ